MRPYRIGMIGVAIALAQGCGWLFQDYREVASTTTGAGGSATTTDSTSTGSGLGGSVGTGGQGATSTGTSSGGGGQGATTGAGGSIGDICGDGMRAPTEGCDDGNAINNDGCSAACVIECSDLFNAVTKHCYRLGTNKTWAAAEGDCTSWHGHLVGLGSGTELPWLVTATQLGMNPLWIGATAKLQQCVFRNSNGEAFWPHFGVDEPNLGANETCVALFLSGDPPEYLMRDADCDIAVNYICERAPGGSCGDGIVQPGEECDDDNQDNNDRCSNACKVKCLPGESFAPTTRRCYAINATPMNGTDASSLACSVGTHPASITSAEENEAVHQLAGGLAVWLGAVWVNPSQGSAGSGLIWSDTSARCAYDNWLNGAPAPNAELLDCVKMNAGGTWSNVPCGDSTLPSICVLDL